MLLTWTVQAQSGSELYVFSLDRPAKGEYHLHSPKYFGHFNEGGYTNQPSFTPTGDLLLSVRKTGENQNDIYSLSLKSRKFKQLTRTIDSEYSPTIHPYEEHLTVLKKVGDDQLDQRVCNIHLKTGEQECLTGELRDIGNYAWMNDHELGLFRIEGGTHKLSYFNVGTQKSRRITSAIGRTLASDKGWLIFVHKFTEDFWYIKRYNPANSEIKIVTQTVGKMEDFALAADGTYFMGKENKLFSFHPDIGKEWKEIGDLEVYGINYISRLAISKDGKTLALIASKEKPL